MKALIAILFAFFILWPKTVTVKYYTNGISNDLIQESVQYWNFKNIKWQQVTDCNQANLVINLTPNLSKGNRYGEANQKEIRINSKYKHTDKALINLLSHEIGHYVFLQHNNKRSIMNNKIPLSKRSITPDDLDGVNFIKLRVIIAKFLGFIVDLTNN